MNAKPACFIIDPALGKLAKWLRIIGFDAHYLKKYRNKEIETLLKEERILLTRNRALANSFKPSILIDSEKIQDQLTQLKENGFLPIANINWFKRCIICNIPLLSVQIDDARGRIPEYIISQNIGGIKFCPSCKRYLWPGSHRRRMIDQLKSWGLTDKL